MSDDGDGNAVVLTTYSTEQGLMAAVADEHLLGSVYEEDGVRLDVSEEFYGGEVVDEATVAETLAEASIANLVGERAVEAGVDSGEIDADLVLRVEGVPHAQMVRV